MMEKKANIIRVEGATFAARTNSNHWIITDTGLPSGGHGAGISPKELLLVALGACTGIDVESILRKKRVKVDRFELNVTAQETEEHPKVYENFHIEYVVYGSGIRKEDVERAIELSRTKYCGVSAMFSKFTAVTHSYRIVAPEPE